MNRYDVNDHIVPQVVTGDVELKVAGLELLAALLDRESAPCAQQYANALVFSKGPVNLFVSLLSGGQDFFVRMTAVLVLTRLLSFASEEVQSVILSNRDGGINNIVDLLESDNEALRNDAVLLLTGLSRGSEELQKVMAFNKVPDKLLSMLATEDNDAVCQDVTALLSALLTNRTNVNLFVETSTALYSSVTAKIIARDLPRGRTATVAGVLAISKALAGPSEAVPSSVEFARLRDQRDSANDRIAQLEEEIKERDAKKKGVDEHLEMMTGAIVDQEEVIEELKSQIKKWMGPPHHMIPSRDVREIVEESF